MNIISFNSPDGEVPIPTAPQGATTRNKDRVLFYISSLPVTISALRNTSRRTALATLFTVMWVPTALSTPSYAYAIESFVGWNSESYAYINTPAIPEDWDETLELIVTQEVSRYQVRNDDWAENVDLLIDTIKHIESDNKARAYNPSGAMSYFQFKGESIKTAHNRLVNYIRRHDLGDIPRWSVNLYYNPEHIYHVSADKQAVLVIVNLIELDREQGTDYFKQFLEGDIEAGKTAYYRYHHTNPDQMTIDRTERLFAQYFD